MSKSPEVTIPSATRAAVEGTIGNATWVGLVAVWAMLGGATIAAIVRFSAAVKDDPLLALVGGLFVLGIGGAMSLATITAFRALRATFALDKTMQTATSNIQTTVAGLQIAVSGLQASVVTVAGAASDLVTAVSKAVEAAGVAENATAASVATIESLKKHIDESSKRIQAAALEDARTSDKDRMLAAVNADKDRQLETLKTLFDSLKNLKP